MQCDRTPVAVLGITDQMRPEASATVTTITELTGATTVLLTGDNRATALRLADQVGITDVRAGLLPEGQSHRGARARGSAPISDRRRTPLLPRPRGGAIPGRRGRRRVRWCGRSYGRP
ncbi:HAD family hydrolase [Nocardia sp. NBC_01388]